jgi:hypothetical protein
MKVAVVTGLLAKRNMNIDTSQSVSDIMNNFKADAL